MFSSVEEVIILLFKYHGMMQLLIVNGEITVDYQQKLNGNMLPMVMEVEVKVVVVVVEVVVKVIMKVIIIIMIMKITIISPLLIITKSKRNYFHGVISYYFL
jgi:hypothetical protein